MRPKHDGLDLRFRHLGSRLCAHFFCALLLGIALLSGAACNTKQAQMAALSQKVFREPAAAQLAQAAATGDTARIDELIKSGADPNAVGDQRTSLLQWTLLQQNTAGFDALLSAGADPAHVDDSGDTAVHYAAKANDATYLDILFAHRVDPNVPNAITGETPLMDALMSSRDVQFHTLLAHGAHPNLADRLGNSSLHVAAKVASHVLDLLDAGADPAARNQRGDTFQSYFKMTPCAIISQDARRERQTVAEWLHLHRLPVEPGLNCV